MDQLPSTIKERRAYLATDFVRFTRYCLKQLGFTPAKIQIEIAQFLQTGDARICVLAARGFGKTYIVSGLYPCWRWLRNPHLKIKILTQSHNRGVEIAEQIINFIRTIDVLQHLAPKRENASKTKFRIRGAMFEKDPSLNVISVGSRATGGRVDLAILDDICDETFDTHERRLTVHKAARQVSAMLHEPKNRPFYRQLKEVPIPERTQIVVAGTYESTESVYIVPQDKSPHFLRGAKIRKWPALNEQGRSNFEERLSTEYLTEMRDNHYDSIYWALQFQLDPDAVQWDACPYKIDKIRQYAIDAPKPPIMWAVCDPSSGNDFTTCVIVGVVNGRLYVYDILAYQNMTSYQSLSKIGDYLKATPEIKTFYIEGNNAAYLDVYREVQRERMVFTKLEPFYATGDKHKRTMQQLEPTINSGSVVFNKKIIDNPNHAGGVQMFKEIAATTYKEGPPEHIHDDVLDTVAHAVRLLKDKIARPGTAVSPRLIA